MTAVDLSDGRSMRERMLAGDLYRGNDADLKAEMAAALRLVKRFNDSDPGDGATHHAVLSELLGALGDETVIRPPLFCEYGSHLRIGARTFVNFGLTALDVAMITIGDDVQIGSHVQLVTPTHPVDPGPRRDGWEAAQPITVGDNVWLGSGVIVCPGVTIGADTVVGAGAVVVRDLPAGVLAVGNPARVVRGIGS